MSNISMHTIRFTFFAMLFLISLMLYICGIILGVIAKKHKQLYEIMMNTLIQIDILVMEEL